MVESAEAIESSKTHQIGNSNPPAIASFPFCNGRFCLEVRKLKIKKTDGRPMAIHTKEKPRLHTKPVYQAKIKGRNILTVSRGPQIAGNRLGIDSAGKKKTGSPSAYAIGKTRKPRQVGLREAIAGEERQRQGHIKPQKSKEAVIKKKPEPGFDAKGAYSKNNNEKNSNEKNNTPRSTGPNRGTGQNAGHCQGREAKGGQEKVAKKALYAKEKQSAAVRMAASAGAGAALEEMEGGREVRESAQVSSALASPLTSAAAAGRRLYRHKAAIREAEKRIKKVDIAGRYRRSGSEDSADGRREPGGRFSARQPAGEAARKSAGKSAAKAAREKTGKAAKSTARRAVKRAAKETAKTTARAVGTAVGAAATGAGGILAGAAAGRVVGRKMAKQELKNSARSRMARLFAAQLRQGESRDSTAKALKDIALMRLNIIIKKTAAYAGLLLAGVFALAALVALPVIAAIAVIYNSPFAIFFPSISSGETTQEVLASYAAQFNREVGREAGRHEGYDRCEKRYPDYEGAGEPDNYADILAVYMVRYGIGDTATDMTGPAKANLKKVFDDMCGYHVSSGYVTETEETVDGEGETATKEVTYHVKYVNITLKSCHDMVRRYHFGEPEQGLLAEIMEPENLALIGYAGTSGGAGEGLSGEQYQAIVDALPDAGFSSENGRIVVGYALAKVGSPYSQEKRDSGTHFDCSSLAYYAWRKAGISLFYEGANTAASEGKYCHDKNCLVDFSEMQPGDLIFYSFTNNGRFRNISHVAIYAGRGMVVEAANERMGVVCRPVYSPGKIVLIGRPG